MKKIDLDKYIASADLVETSDEALKNINGGCIVKIGRCKKDGKYWVASVSQQCSKYSTHVSTALAKAKQTNIALGTFVTYQF